MLLIRQFIREFIAAGETSNRMTGGPKTIPRPEQAKLNDDNIELGDSHLNDDTPADVFGPVPPNQASPKCYQDPLARDFLRWTNAKGLTR